MHKKVLSAIMALGLVLATGAQVMADPALDSQINSSKSKYDQSQSTLSVAEKKYNDLQVKVQTLDEKISQNMNDIDGINKKMDKLQVDMDATQSSINKAESDINGQQAKYNEMMKATYANESSGGNLNILLSSKGLNDFISKIEIIKKLKEYDNKVIADLKQRKEEVQSKKDSLIADKVNLSALKDQSEKKIADLDNQKALITPLVASAKAEQDVAMATSSTYKDQVDALNKQSQNMKAAALALVAQSAKATASVNRGGSYTGGNSVISYASQFIGIYYKSGGSTPAGFDCSGFVQYVYSHMGVSIDRTTYTQINDGVPVTGALQPGDLVFFGNPTSPHHVGIYVGNGQMIDSPQTGETIGIHNLYSDYSAARRVQ
ncbi:C40 family peptidase [Clostridium akagii]|uniref:C40 family peptidase n=1 Tax=Clostridium akagii TaxID=91623 RepID=UPI000479FF60|nr:C40 family peptidase [Clostridium akagii]